MKKILMLTNSDEWLYNLRIELINRLVNENYDVHVSTPDGNRVNDLKKSGCTIHLIDINSHGKNPIKEFVLINKYKSLVKKLEPDYILGYTIKPNLYGALAAKKFEIPFLANITGLGTALENESVLQKFLVRLYRYSFKEIDTVFVQNEENMNFFIDNNIATSKLMLLPGSGVNLERFELKDYPDGSKIRFAFISRIMKEKGTDYYLNAAKCLKEKYDNVEFHVCGACEQGYEKILKKYEDNGVIIYHGMIKDIPKFLDDIHCVIHPTYYPEGISNVLLEACASGRPIITTDRSGCREVVDDGINGYMIPTKDSDALIEAIERFISLSNEQKRNMGINGRKKVEKEFDRKIVINKYLELLE